MVICKCLSESTYLGDFDSNGRRDAWGVSGVRVPLIEIGEVM